MESMPSRLMVDVGEQDNKIRVSDQASEKIGSTNVKIMDDQRDHSSGVPPAHNDSYHEDFEDDEDRGSAKFETMNGSVNDETQRSAELKAQLTGDENKAVVAGVGG